MNEYANSVEREAAEKMREREIFRDASGLWHTLMDDGGFTFRPDRGTPNYGYMVSDGKSELKVRTCTVETIYRYLRDHWEIFKTHPMSFIGAWIGDDGFTYLDVSEWYVDRNASMALARERGERAIYSILIKTALYVEE